MYKAGTKKELQQYFEQPGNQLVVVSGQPNCGKESLIMEFAKDKRCFYYRCREADAGQQLKLMGEEISRQYEVRLLEDTYEEYFTKIRRGDAVKLLLVIDEAQYLLKKDSGFMEAVVKLKKGKLHPGQVMIVLATSDLVWAGQHMERNMGENFRQVDGILKIEDLNFLEVVRAFPEAAVSECVQIYGILGGVPGYLTRWNQEQSLKENICRLVLSEEGYLYGEAERLISRELREMSVYNTILSNIASGKNKLNDLFLETGFSRAKISVYMKNLSQFDIVEKLVSFETGGWDNAKKGIYQIKNTYVNFWYKFVYPHLSDLYRMEPEKFYDAYIAPELDAYLQRYFRNVCMEYLMLLNQLERLPFAIHKMGTWVGKTGTIDIIAQSTDRRNIVGLCNWEKPELTAKMCEEMAESMKKARISSQNYYLFSAKAFSKELIRLTTGDERFTLIDMNEL